MSCYLRCILLGLLITTFLRNEITLYGPLHTHCEFKDLLIQIKILSGREIIPLPIPDKFSKDCSPPFLT